MRARMVCAIGLAALAGAGCNVLGPTCLAQQSRGQGSVVAGRVEAGQIVAHILPYDPRGSQNDVAVSWEGQDVASGAKLTFHATRAACDTAPRPGAARGDDCEVLASAGATAGGQAATTLVITHGRGNPDVLGTPPEFKVWVIGDPSAPASYLLSVTWFYGPDC